MQLTFRLPSVIGLSILLWTLAGCATVPANHRVHHSLLDQPARSMPAQVVLLPPDITVSEISAGGVVEEVEAWSRQANANVVQALNKYATSNASLGITALATVGDKEREVIDEHLALYDVVAGDAFRFSHFGGPAWQHKINHFDYTIGDGLAFLCDKTGSDAALVVIGADQISSSGRKAAVVVAAMFGVGIPLGASFLTAGVVDLKTGDILWFNYSTSYANRDLRNPDDADVMVKELFASFPGVDAFLQAKAK